MEGENTEMDDLLQHVGHEHPLLFVDVPCHKEGEGEEADHVCGCCGYLVEGPSYRCNELYFFSDLFIIVLLVVSIWMLIVLRFNHLQLYISPIVCTIIRWFSFKTTRSSFIVLIAKHVRTLYIYGPIYKCFDCCGFLLHEECGVLLCGLNYPHDRTNLRSVVVHQHPLLFIQDQDHEGGEEEDEDHLCGCCGKRILEGPRYRCRESSCRWFYLHKRCAELELPPVIKHPFHPQHPLIFQPKYQSDWSDKYDCRFCRRSFHYGFVYHCASCRVDFDVDCALFQPSISTEEVSSCLHDDHPLFLIENHREELYHLSCIACDKPLSGPIYTCFNCWGFYLHKECGELTPQINHPYDRAHRLSMEYSGTHREGCFCYLCKIGWQGLVYSCSICNIQLTLEEVTARRTITIGSHQHPWTLVKYPISFICQFCGVEEGDRTPYICTTCDVIVHKKCISLPRAIRIARHQHPISHAIALPFSLQQDQQPEKELVCRICFQEVNVRYGIYHCSVYNCNYFAHVNCATDKNVWDGTVVPEDEMSKEVADSRNLITDIIREETVGEEVMATETFHDHNLILSVRGEMEMEDDSICDGCMLPISSSTDPFYKCQHHDQECKFVLHKSCAELPREMGHAIHKHLLKLTNNDDLSFCKACFTFHHGFSYKCDREECEGYQIDVQCSLLPDVFSHPSHQHSLFLFHNNKRKRCAGYCRTRWTGLSLYRCTKRCKFHLNFECVRLPLSVGYKYDRHPLALTYQRDYSDETQLYCDICEEKRESWPWFYHCASCDNSVHQECVLGELPFIKPGRLYIDSTHEHQHTLTFVDNIWDCPLCSKCRKLCHRQALQCKESGCNFVVHWSCLERNKNL